MSKLKTYSGELISPKGEVVLELLYEGKPHVARFLVAEDNYSNLLSRDVLANLRLQSVTKITETHYIFIKKATKTH